MTTPVRQNVAAPVEATPHRGRRHGPLARRPSLKRTLGRSRKPRVVVHGAVEPTDAAMELLAAMFEDWMAEGGDREGETDD